MLRRPSKGIKILKSCYPEKDATNQNLTVVSHKLEDLFKYILLNPQKLSEIGKYLEKRTKRDLYKGQHGFVKISLSIFNSIIQSSQSNMFTFYAPYAVSVMQEIFSVEANYSSMQPATVASFKVIATETFVRFSKARYNNNITEYQDVGYFLNYFIDMCNPSAKLDNETKLKLRFCGLKGIYNYITTVDDIDAFVAKYIDRIDVNKTGIMNAILSFLLEFDSFAKTVHIESITESDRDKENENGIYVLAFSCLGELSKPASATTLKSLLFAVLDFFTVHKAWSQPEFVHNCIKALAVKPQHNQTILSQLLFYLDMVPEARMKIHVVKTISFFFDEIGRSQSPNDNSAPGGTGPVIEVLIPLIRQLTLANDSDVSDNEDKDLESYENAIIQALGSAARKVVDPSEKLEAIGYIMDKIRGHKAAHITSVLLQCVLQVAFHLKELPFSKAVPSKIFEPLLTLSTNNDPTVRVIVQQIFHCLLQLHSSHRASVTLLSKTMEQDERTEKRNHAIRLSLFKQALLDNNQPENFTAIYQTFCLLLQLYRGRELELSFPILFKLESLATSEETIAPHLGRCIHCVVGAYLLQVAKLYGSNMLEEYISQTMSPEWSRYVKLNDQDEFIAKKKKFSKKKVKLEERVKTPIDRERVVSVLSQTHLVKELSGKDFKQTLMQEMTQDDQSEVINNITSTPGYAQQGVTEETSNNNNIISTGPSRKRQGSSVDSLLVKDFTIIKYKFDDLKNIFEPAENNTPGITPQVPEPSKPAQLTFQTVAAGCELQAKERLQTLSQVFEMVPVLCELSDKPISLENITFPKLFHILDFGKENIVQ